MAVQLNRAQQARIYTPRGKKPLLLGTPFIPSTAAAAYPTGTIINIAAGAVDLSTPLLGMQFTLKGRATIGTAAVTALTPESFLNLFFRMDIFGQHKILQSDTHPFVMDGAMWSGILGLHRARGFRLMVSKAGAALTNDPQPQTPYGGPFAAGAAGGVGFDGTTNTFDFIVDIPVYFYPLDVGDTFKPGFMWRSEEWGDSVQLQITPGGQPTANANAGSLGTSGGTTTVSFTGFQSGSGTPTLDIYGLPVIQGATTGLPAQTVPGLIIRSTSPRTTQVQTTGTDIQLAQLQKRKTSRVYLKAGLSTNPPVFTSLSDTMLNKVGLQVGTDKFPRNKVDWTVWKHAMADDYDAAANPIQGYATHDFLQHNSPFGSYAGDNIDAGSTFYLIGDPNGAATNTLLVVQEQIIREPEGELYNY
jgi:hypothetical protein